jgi:hypothetical protein
VLTGAVLRSLSHKTLAPRGSSGSSISLDSVALECVANGGLLRAGQQEAGRRHLLAARQVSRRPGGGSSRRGAADHNRRPGGSESSRCGRSARGATGEQEVSGGGSSLWISLLVHGPHMRPGLLLFVFLRYFCSLGRDGLARRITYMSGILYIFREIFRNPIYLPRDFSQMNL